MKERPIIFSAPMVRAILAGRKTQTRRVIADSNSQGNYRASELLLDHPNTFVDGGPSPAGNPGPYLHAPVNARLIEERRGWKEGDCDDTIVERLYPRYCPGLRLWVREGWRHQQTIQYLASSPWQNGFGEGWRSPIHMPRWASRITLDITGMRAERLQDISEADAIAEGLVAQVGDGGKPRAGWKWDGIGYEGSKPGYFHTPHPDKPRCRCVVAGPTPAQCAYRDLWESIHGAGAWDKNPWVWIIEFKRAE